MLNMCDYELVKYKYFSTRLHLTICSIGLLASKIGKIIGKYLILHNNYYVKFIAKPSMLTLLASKLFLLVLQF